MIKVPFNVPSRVGTELNYIQQALNSNKISGDGFFSNKCTKWFKKHLKVSCALLTPSCTHALEMAAILIGIKSGDEVIMPSYTFVSTANAFVLRGAKIVFVDVIEHTMNIDPKLIESAITSKTKAIVPVHYGGFSCDMDAIMKIAKKNNIYVVEDAAQGLLSHYKGKALGTIGNFGTISFHETKNITSGGEGGLLLIRDKVFAERAEIIREKGTNRSNFSRGLVNKYTWVDVGSSFLPSELQAAYLYCQLENINFLQDKRLNIWNYYYSKLKKLENKNYIKIPVTNSTLNHNGHIFFIKLKSPEKRKDFLNYTKKQGIECVFHYIPLHNSEAGKKFGKFHGNDKNTTIGSNTIVRLPLYNSMNIEQAEFVVKKIFHFFKEKY